MVSLIFFFTYSVIVDYKNGYGIFKRKYGRMNLRLNFVEEELERIENAKKQTLVTSFKVIKTNNDFETIGEQFDLTYFGEYAPNNSLRGYSLSYLLSHKENYRINSIMQQGELIYL